jgi:hypothetical protein
VRVINATGGTVSPGMGGVGTLTTAAKAVNTTLNGTTFQVDVNGPAGSDQLVIGNTATIDLTGGMLSVNVLESATGNVYTIVSSASGGISNTFAGLANGATITAGGRNFQISYTSTAVTLIDTTPLPPPPSPPPAANPIFATGADAGGSPEVKVFDASTGALKLDFMAFDPAFTGGVRVAVGDVDGDGVADIIAGAGPTGLPEVRVFDGRTGAPIRDFFAFNPLFTGGVFVAAGDINKDGFADIVVGADAGGAPEVRAFSGRDNSLLLDFFAYDPAFGGGVRVAAGDVNGDGYADIITGPGYGGAPEVKVFSGRGGVVLEDYFAYTPLFTGGIFVAAGDVNGDGLADVITSPGLGGGPEVKVFSGANAAPLLDFFAYPPVPVLVPVFGASPQQGGCHVGFTRVNGRGEILTGPDFGLPPEVKAFDAATLQLLDDFFAYDPSFLGGVYVGG